MTGNKEIDAILAEMRRDADDGAIAIFTPLGQRTYADRIEAAARKERAILDANIARVRELEGMLGNAADALLGCAIEQKRAGSGNVGLLRMALDKAESVLLCAARFAEAGNLDDVRACDFDGALSQIRDALAAPARIVDDFARAENARAAFMRDARNTEGLDHLVCLTEVVRRVCDWIYSPADGGGS